MKSKTLLLIVAFFLITTEGNCISAKAARDGAEEVLYGSNPITSRLVEQLLEKIDTDSKPLLDPAPRDMAKAKKVVNDSKRELEAKITAPDESLEDIKKRIETFLSLADSDFDPNPLSFLIEEIASKI
jgi:hypothetical protein